MRSCLGQLVFSRPFLSALHSELKVLCHWGKARLCVFGGGWGRGEMGAESPTRARKVDSCLTLRNKLSEEIHTY